MFKKLLSVVLSAATAVSFIPQIPARAEEAVRYPYVMFAGSAEEGAITINSNNVCINGSIATNGTISTTAQNFNVNGSRTENAQETMKFFFDKIDSRYFTSHVDTYFEDFFLEDTNINVNIPIEAEGDIGLTGNINITSGIKALNDVVLSGNVENSQDSVICAETGDIIIDTDNVNLNGLVYAPNGCVNITAQNLNINSVIIIADTITITCPNLNANYNAQMAELIGNGSEPINTDDIEIVAYGEYDTETEAFSVYWNTTVPDGNFDIQASDDGENYTSIGTVNDTDSFEFSFTDPFEKKYIKVIETVNSGKVGESVPFVVISTEDGYDVEVLDSDEDGLPDIYELKIGTDPYDQDTDDDGLTDYQEYVYTQTDPLVYDSVTEGVSDADIDTDEDGLSNIDEFTRGTYPWSPDTDQDGLSDYDEIYVYGTDPLVADSDEDGVDDGSEVKLGLDPNDPATNGVPDGEYIIPQTIAADSSILSTVNTAESPYELSIDIKTNGDAEKELTVDESGYSAAIENDAMLGASFDVEITDTCNPEEIVLKYDIKEGYINNDPSVYSGKEQFQGINRFAVFKYFEEVKALLPLYTEYDEITNTISANVEDGGTYCIMDTEKWFSDLGVDLSETDEETESPQALRQNAPKALTSENTVQSTVSSQKKGRGAYGYLFEDTPVDLVFMIQTTGSNNDWQKENFEFQKKLIHDISAYAFKRYKDVWVHIIPYGYTVEDDSDELNDGWPMETDMADVNKVLSKVEYIPNSTYAYRNLGYRKTVKNLYRSYRPYSKKYVINLINGTTNFDVDKYDGIYFQQDCEWVYYYFWANDMIFSEIVYNGNNFDPYLHEYINGNPIDIDLDKTTMIRHIVDNIGVDLTLDTISKSNYNDVIENINKHVSRKSLYGAYSPVDWKPIVLSGELNSQNGIDTDGDCLTDWEEIDTSQLIMYDDGSFDLLTIQDMINKIESYIYRETIKKLIESKLKKLNILKMSKAEEDFYKKGVLPLMSSPIQRDSDNDGYTDLEDPESLKAPIILGGKYDFLDKEIYCLRAIETSTINPSLGDFTNKDYIYMKNGSDTPGTSLILNALDIQEDDYKFRFEWCGDGYKIHSVTNDSLVLTADISSQTVSMQLDKNYNRQKWEVLPYKSNKYLWGTNNFDGIIFRCKECIKSDKNNNSFIPLYLNYGEGSLTISTERNNNNCLYPVELGSWNKFGKTYMIFNGWMGSVSNDIIRAMKNYVHNSKIGVKEKTNPIYIKTTVIQGKSVKTYEVKGEDFNYVEPDSIRGRQFSNIYNELGNESCNCIGNYRLLHNQFGGNFPLMVYVNSDSSKKMDYSCCEIMATFNLLSVAGCYDITGSDGNITNDLNQYSRLVLEFELSDLMFDGYTSYATGRWGSKPYGIKNCLDAYNLKTNDYGFIKSDIDQIENEIKNNKGFAIISTCEKPVPVHTWFVFFDQDTSEFVGVNRSSGSLSGWRRKDLKEVIKTADEDWLFGGHILL